MKHSRKLIFLFLVIATLLSLFAACKEKDPNEGKLVFAKNGEALYTIIVASDASDAVRIAAGELQSYLEKITGARFDVLSDETEENKTEFCVGQTNREPEGGFAERPTLGEEGFIIRNTDQKLYLFGGGDRGTLYAVYTFLEEHLGVRFYTETVEKIPAASTLAIDPFEKDNYQKPRFIERRESFQPDACFSWNEKQKLNVATNTEKLPIAGGINYTGPWYVHTFGSLLGWNSAYSYKRQPCLSSPGTYEKMLKSAKYYISKNPDADIISISQNDSTLAESGECQCESCVSAREQYGSSGVVLRFVNRLANALRSEYPDITVETLAYYYTQEPPKGGVIPESNVIVRFCIAGSCTRHALTEDSAESENFYEQNAGIAYQNLIGWAKVCDNLRIWDYGSNFGCTGAPISNYERIYDNITTCYNTGARGFFMQGMSESGDFPELAAYLTAKLLWNPKMTRDEFYAHMTDFLEGYYGVEAAPYLRAYIDDITALTADAHTSMYVDPRRYLPIGTKTDETGATVTDTEHIDRLNKYFDDAENAAHSYTEVRRIRKARLSVLYYEIVSRFVTLEETGENIENLAKLNQVYYNAMNSANVTRLKEGVKIPNLPNFYNAPLYWGEKYQGVYSDESLEAAREAEKKAASGETEGETETEAENAGEESAEEDTETIDVTKAED